MEINYSISDELGGVIDPKIWCKCRHCFKIAVTVTNGTGFYPSSAAGLHVARGVAYHQAFLGLDAEYFQGFKNYIRLGFGGESVGSLDVIEIGDEAELFQDYFCGRRAFGGRG